MAWVKSERYKQDTPKAQLVVLIQAAQGNLFVNNPDKAQEFLEEAQEILCAYQDKPLEEW